MRYYFPASQPRTPTSNQATVEMVTRDNFGSQSQAVKEQPVPETQEPATTSSLRGIWNLRFAIRRACMLKLPRDRLTTSRFIGGLTLIFWERVKVKTAYVA